MRARISLGTTIALIFIAIALAVSLTMIFAMDKFSSTVTEVNKKQVMYEYLTEVDKTVRDNYAGFIDESKLQNGLAASYMDAIGDKYADYLTPDEYASVLQEKEGTDDSFGISIALTGLDRAMTIVRVNEGSVADAAGIKVGDVLVSIDSVKFSSTEQDYEEAVSYLNDANKALITIRRDGKEQSFDLVAASYQIQSVTSEMLEDSIAYIRISSFNALTVDQFRTAIEKVNKQGSAAYIFDLRDNTGGTLEAASEIIGFLLPIGTYGYVVDGKENREPLIADSAYELNGKAVVLVNKATAGEAELFAGTLQELGLAKVYGERTFGKSYRQEYFPIASDNAAVKLTVSQMHLLKSGSWEDAGITPDKEMEAPTNYVNVDSLLRGQDTFLNEAILYIDKQGLNAQGETSIQPSEETSDEQQTTVSKKETKTTTTQKQKKQ